MDEYRSGLVGVLGQTNVGKSTFLNSILGEKLLLTSTKPQATRNRIRCVLTTDRAQIVFVDTPGLHHPRTKLSRYIVRKAYRSLRGLDVLIYVIEAWGRLDPFDREIMERLGKETPPVILLVNKIDIAKRGALEKTLVAYAETGRFAELIPISATEGTGLDDALETLIGYLPVTPPLFPPEVKYDQSEEFLIGELIREKATELTHREVPYSIAVRVKWIVERDDGIVEIKAEIITERESQKGIVIGRGGRMIKEIGTRARTDIERLLGRRVYLELIAKVRPSWTSDEEKIRELTGSE